MATIEEIRAYAARIKVTSDHMKDNCALVAEHMATVLEGALQFPKGDLAVDVYQREDHGYMAQFSTKVEHVLYNVNGIFTIVGDPASPLIETMTIGGHDPFLVTDDARLVQDFTENLLRQVRESAKFKVEISRQSFDPDPALDPQEGATLARPPAGS